MAPPSSGDNRATGTRGAQDAPSDAVGYLRTKRNQPDAYRRRPDRNLQRLGKLGNLERCPLDSE
jgi:hypothetical protein